LNFNDNELICEHKTPEGFSFPSKSYYKGEFYEGLFEGQGEMVGNFSTSLNFKLPLLIPHD
jgi:hypothetical protein